MNILFICNQNENRSKTAAELFKGKYNTQSAGLYCPKPLSSEQMSWADVVIVMEEEQRHELAKRFPKQYLQKRILNLDIPDVYSYNNPKLVKELKLKLKDYDELLA